MQEEKNTKMVIVMRKDLNMRRGKMIAQGSHASMAFLTKGMFLSFGSVATIHQTIKKDFGSEVDHWLRNSFRKIVCYVNSEQELEELHARALEKGLISHLVIDNGATEFNNVPTKTCIAIGPAEDSKFFALTDHLPLL